MTNWLDAPDTTLVCYCTGVDKGTLVASIAQGNLSLSRIKESTGACTGNNCASANPSREDCSSDIYALIRLYGDDDLRAHSIGCQCGRPH